MKAVLIYNPASGKGIKKATLEKFENILKQYDYTPTIYKTNYPNHASEIIQTLKPVDLVISIGGDGTFSEVVDGNLKRKHPLVISHIPVGTTNDVGAMYGYGKDMIENLHLLLKGKVEEIDICYLNNKPFIYTAGFGKFVKVSYDTPKRLKQKLGYFAYLIEALKELNGKTKLYDFIYEVNGEKVMGKYSLILVSNANRIAGIDNFYKDVKLNDGKFEVLFCNLSHKKDIIKGLIALATKEITKASGFEFYKTDYLKIISNEKQVLPFSLDGEKYIEEEKEICFSLKKKIKIKMPIKNIATLMEEQHEDKL